MPAGRQSTKPCQKRPKVTLALLHNMSSLIIPFEASVPNDPLLMRPKQRSPSVVTASQVNSSQPSRLSGVGWLVEPPNSRRGRLASAGHGPAVCLRRIVSGGSRGPRDLARRPPVQPARLPAHAEQAEQAAQAAQAAHVWLAAPDCSTVADGDGWGAATRRARHALNLQLKAISGPSSARGPHTGPQGAGPVRPGLCTRSAPGGASRPPQHLAFILEICCMGVVWNVPI